MTFATTLQSIPTARTQGEGRGLVLSLLKALNHATYIRATPEADRTPEFIAGEINAIATHLNDEHFVPAPAATDRFNELTNNLATLGADLLREAPDWDAATLDRNINELLNRVTAIATLIDAELAGITDAQQGSRL